MARQLTQAALAAKEIIKILKKEFRIIKFSVNLICVGVGEDEEYVIRVCWENGVKEKKIQDRLYKFRLDNLDEFETPDIYTERDVTGVDRTFKNDLVEIYSSISGDKGACLNADFPYDDCYHAKSKQEKLSYIDDHARLIYNIKLEDDDIEKIYKCLEHKEKSCAYSDQYDFVLKTLGANFELEE